MLLTFLVLVPFSMSQILMVLSWEPVSKLLVTNENLQALIVSLWPANVWIVRIVFNFQSIALCSVEAAASNSLSIDIDTSVMALLKPRSVYTSLPFAVLHNLTSESAPPVAIASPIVLNVRQVASYLWAAILISAFDGTVISIKGAAFRYSGLMKSSRFISVGHFWEPN